VTAAEAWTAVTAILAIVLGLNLILLLALSQGPALWRWWTERRQRRIAAIEAELDRKSDELQQAIYEMASQLRMDGRQARQDILREAYWRSGHTPHGDD
jgi:hypothetical protein